MSRGRCDLGSCRGGRVLPLGITTLNHANVMDFRVRTTKSLGAFTFRSECQDFGKLHVGSLHAVMQRVTVAKRKQCIV